MRSSLCLGFAFILLSAPLNAAEWRECEKAKLKELRLLDRARTASPIKQRSKRRTNTQSSYGSADEIETWLWKNCREYSYELRALEQQNM